jgi:hypothetical protein
MLRFTVEILPGGRQRGKRTIATINVGNISDLAAISDYEFAACLDDQDFVVNGRVNGHRRSDGWMPLVKRILETLEAESCS